VLCSQQSSICVCVEHNIINHYLDIGRGVIYSNTVYKRELYNLMMVFES